MEEWGGEGWGRSLGEEGRGEGTSGNHDVPSLVIRCEIGGQSAFSGPPRGRSGQASSPGAAQPLSPPLVMPLRSGACVCMYVGC
ncbi:hypothetical protein E2C01_095878 [Portunus trituberculatus]|uniref:Uncharacterized protein n=1 Tax=Portunus trituberculatus TaxID=210409 RepID=A0A5B7K5F8_PORTR|nr:hypothetical protein [Portunus trituberculatus]